MSWTPKDSRIAVDSELEQAIAAAGSATEISTLLRAAAEQQGLVIRDRFNPDITYEVNASKGFAKTIVVNGVKHTAQGSTEQELLADENRIFREIVAPAVAAAAAVEQPRDSAGRFTTAEQEATDQADAVRRSELDLKFKRGEVSAKDYIEQSGAVTEYLTDQGVDMAALQEVSGQKYARSWADATTEFLQRNPTWPGGDANRDLLGRLIAENNLIDSDPLAALEAAYSFAKEHNLLTENPEVAAQKSYADAIAAAQTPSEIEAVNAEFFPASRRASGSVLFNR